MRNASQPFGVSDPERPNISPTIWRTIANLTQGVYYFESSTNPSLIWVYLEKIDFSGSAGVWKLELVDHPDLAGDMSAEFHRAKPFEPLRPDSDD